MKINKRGELVLVNKIVGYTAIFFLVFSITQVVYAQEDRALYYSGVNAALNGETDFAFMEFHALLNGHRMSKYYKDALFSAGEYYYSIKDYANAAGSFSKFIENYSEANSLPFAIAYLVKINKIAGTQQIIYDLKRKLIEFMQLSLLFSEFKEYTHESALNMRYKARYFIDKIEIYIDGKLFEEIHF